MSQSNLSDGAADGLAAVIIVLFSVLIVILFCGSK